MVSQAAQEFAYRSGFTTTDDAHPLIFPTLQQLFVDTGFGKIRRGGIHFDTSMLGIERNQFPVPLMKSHQQNSFLLSKGFLEDFFVLDVEALRPMLLDFLHPQELGEQLAKM